MASGHSARLASPTWRSLTRREAEEAIARGMPVLTDDPSVLTACDAIDVLVEVTGTVEAAAGVVLEAFEHGKHVVLVNAELDSLIGPILKAKADQAGVVVTHTDGDEPGVAMTLLRYLRHWDSDRWPPATSRAWSTTIATPRPSGRLPRRTTRTSGRSLPSPTPRSYPWRRPFSPMRPDFTPAAAACTVRPAMMCGRWRTCCRPNRCSRPAWSTMLSARRRIPAPSSSFTRTRR